MEQDQEQEQQPVTITDKRGQKKDDLMPTAEELLADDVPSNPALAAQLAEEQERLAQWEAMTDKEKQEVLAQQAAEQQGVPFQGAGMQAPPSEDAGKKKVLTMFAIVVHSDGTAVATDNMDVSMFEAEYEVDASKMYRAVCEIKKDIESTDAAAMVMRFMNQQMAAMQQQAQAESLANQLKGRGVPVPPRRGRRN